MAGHADEIVLLLFLLFDVLYVSAGAHPHLYVAHSIFLGNSAA